ncbi:MAG: hypothetical protein GX219_08620 [Tissierellia bacterium]|nr:hypothetical protein [Tissierellia bacterium]
MANEKLVLSTLPKTWVFDIDGTIVVHRKPEETREDILLEGVKDFFDKIPKEDVIILLTARKDDKKEMTENFLNNNGIRYDHIIYNVPAGERILINDIKPKGLKTAIALNVERDIFPKIDIEIDKSI